MKDRKNRTIIKSSNLEELKVWRAESLDNQIRFYLNDTQYIAATERNNGEIWVEIGENVRGETNKKSILTLIKEDFKRILTSCGIIMLLCVAVILLGVYISCLIGNFVIGIFFINIMMWIVFIVYVILIEFQRMTATRRSKHSAEHMMVNFLENNNRLPKSMKEIRACSRFSENCGTRIVAESIVQLIMTFMLTEIMVFIICVILCHFFNNIILKIIVTVCVFVTIFIIVYIRIKKYEKMQFVIALITSVLSNLMQCANTTKNVEDNDILLAYCAAKYWIKEVYPEFYNEEDDVFLDNYEEVNKREVDN